LFTSVVGTGKKFIVGVVVTGDDFSAVSRTPVINLLLVSTTQADKKKPRQRLFTGVNDTADKFVSAVVDTAEQFIAGVQNTADKHSTFIGDYLCEFSKKVEMVLMEYSGARGTLIHEKKT
jgi:hypothetical protein